MGTMNGESVGRLRPVCVRFGTKWLEVYRAYPIHGSNDWLIECRKYEARQVVSGKYVSFKDEL